MSDNYCAQRTQALQFSRIRDVLLKIEAAEQQGIAITNLSIGRPDFDTPAHIKAAAKQALDDGFVHYVKVAGIDELRAAICHRLQKDYQLVYKPEQVVVTAGSTEAVFIALQSIIDPGDEVIIPELMYPHYRGWCALSGATLVPLPLDAGSFSLNMESFKQNIRPQTRAVLINSPHNPTGQVFDKSALLELAQLAVQHDFLILSDDAYSYMLYDGMTPCHIAQLDGMQERTLILGSFSKTYAMDGWRIGYLVGPPSTVTAALKIHMHATSSLNSFAQVGAVAALKGDQDCVQEMVQELDRRRRFIMACLGDMGIPFVRPQGTFYIFPSIKQFGMTSSEFGDFLLDEAAVAVVPGDAFGPAGEGYVRIAYTKPYEEIEKGMERIRRAIKKL